MGFITLLSDQCVYIWNVGKPNITFIATYINNLLIIGQDKAIIQDIKDNLNHKFKIKDLESVS